VTAVKRLNTPLGGSSRYANFTAIHYAVGSCAHGSPGFFVWHRYFLRQFEKALQDIDPSVALPYWDVTRDSQSALREPSLIQRCSMPGTGPVSTAVPLPYRSPRPSAAPGSA
jgi:hypothetical protein